MMNITNRNRMVAPLVICVIVLVSPCSFGGPGVPSLGLATSFFNNQLIVLKIQFDSSKRNNLITEKVRILYLTNMIAMLKAFERATDGVDIKIMREVLSPPQATSDLEIQRRAFAISGCIRILINELSTPFGDPINLEDLNNATKSKGIEERLNELKGYGSWAK